MESQQSRAALEAVTEARAAMAARIPQPRWHWVVMGALLGTMIAVEALPVRLHGLSLAVKVLCLVGMATVLLAIRRAPVSVRQWGGARWFMVVVLCSAVVFTATFSTAVPAPARYVVAGVVVAMVYCGTGIVADRLRVRHATRDVT